jgi:hypothetical protein
LAGIIRHAVRVPAIHTSINKGGIITRGRGWISPAQPSLRRTGRQKHSVKISFRDKRFHSLQTKWIETAVRREMKRKAAMFFQDDRQSEV